MYKIKITNDSLQKHTIIIPELGTSFKVEIYFVPMQYGWFIKELTYNDFTIRNIRITNNLQLLHQWRNRLPFGLSCISKEDREPMFQNDFSEDHSILRLVDSSEVIEYTGDLSA